MATDLEASLDVTILGETFSLTGKFLNSSGTGATAKPAGVQVSWGPFDAQSAPSLNAVLSDVVKEIQSQFGVDSSFNPASTFSTVSNVPGLKNIAAGIQTAQVKITLLQIDTVNKNFKFGFALLFPAGLIIGDSTNSLNITIHSFGLTIVHPPTP